jgi:galactokinase
MSDTVRAFAPGRVNLIGEHTDYNAGLALPFAVTAGVTVQARATGGRLVRAEAVDLDETDEFSLDDPPRAEGWRAFVRGAVAELERERGGLRAAALHISGDVPRGGGLSSSAALEVALCLALIGLTGREPPEPIHLAELCSRIENDWVGAQTGLLDQLASLCGRAGHGVLIDFRSFEIETLPVELGDHRLVTLDSGEAHANAGSGYNERRRECAEACRRLGVRSLRDADLTATERLPEPLGRRVRHVVTENQRVREAVHAHPAAHNRALGPLLSASHASLRDDYEVSTPAVEEAIARLRDAGSIGARIVGGGFGGNVLGLLPSDAVAPEGAVEVAPGPGAHLL